MADDAFASFERKWLDANPEQAAVLLFLPPDERRPASTFGALVHELAQTAFGIRETHVAAAKLGWWQQELNAAHAGRARHPITVALFADARVRAIEPAKWNALVEGAMLQLDAPTASDFRQLVERYARFYAPVASVENELFAAAGTSIDAVSNIWSCSHALSASTGGAPLAYFIGEIRAMLDASLRAAPRASIGCRVRARADRQRASAAMRSDDPAASLARHRGRPTLRHVWYAWREARRT